jgi:hypothetical protein
MAVPKVSLVYPDSLPCPRSATLQWTERRALSDLPGVRQSRVVSRDRHGMQALEFILQSEQQVADWVEWGNMMLGDWGHWFAAEWPQPQGGIGVRRFVGTPSYPAYLPLVGWRVQADVEMRGRGELPMIVVSNCTEGAQVLDTAFAEVALLYEFRVNDPDPVPATTSPIEVIERTAGLPVPGFPCNFSIAWGDLPDLPTIAYFSCTRDGTGSSIVSANFEITDLPDEGAAICKAVVFQTTGGWTNGGTVPNGAVTVNADGLGYSTFQDTGPGADALTGYILLRNNRGTLTAALN